MLGRVLDVVAHVAMLSVATVKIVLIGILANDLRTNVLVIGKTEIVSSNNFELRHTDVSNGHVIHRMKTRSKLECAISCQIEPRCKTFLYEAPSSVCSIYREVTQYGCFEPVAQNVSRYFIGEMKQTRHEGRKEMFYLTTHSTHFYGYMASDIW